jgi:predicted ATP-grasp superfamily ATP-dependent carboligase
MLVELPPISAFSISSVRNCRSMRLLLYEWCCSGGLGGRAPSECFASITREGRAMLEALAADAAKDASLDVTVLVDPVRPLTLPRRVLGREVPTGTETESLVAAAREHDWTVIVAPETDGILASRVAAARAAGARVLAPSAAFIGIASDKQATVNALAAAGVPVPAGRSLAPGEMLPIGFHLPAVRKDRASVGCDGLQVIRDSNVAPAALATRLEAFVTGTPVGVSCLCGPDRIEVLPPMRQRFTAGDAARYVGSDPLDDELLAARAQAIARRAVEAVMQRAVTPADHAPPAIGWVGVDMILGLRDDGRADRVLEVNPRMTTSFVALAARSGTSLVQTMLAVAAGVRVSDEPA